MSSDRSSSPLLDTLEQCSTFEYILLGHLRELLEEPLDEVNRRWLQAVLDALLTTLPREMELHEADGGYLCAVTEEVPHWQSRIGELWRQKGSLYEVLRRWREALRQPQPSRRITNLARRELRRWLTAFVEHQRREARLLQEAWNWDVGVGD